MADAWYIAREGRQYGPYAWDELVRYAASGNVTAEDLVWSESTGDWTPASQVPGLLPAPPARHPLPISSSEANREPGRKKSRKSLLLGCGGLSLLLVLACACSFIVFRSDLLDLDRERSVTGPAADDAPFWREDAEIVTEQSDRGDWRLDPDLEQEKAAIAQTIEGFSEAMKRGDLDASVAFIQDERREAYRELFSTNPDAMASFADLISGGEMSFLGEQPGPTSYNRIAEYAIDLDGFTFYVVLMKVDDRWVLYDF